MQDGLGDIELHRQAGPERSTLSRQSHTSTQDISSRQQGWAGRPLSPYAAPVARSPSVTPR